MSLTQLPSEVLEEISKNLDFRSILSLRKVCKDLRNFIDDVIPPSSATKLYIRINMKRISLSLFDPKSPEFWIKIKYKNHSKGCSIIKSRKEKKIKTRVGKPDLDNFVSIFWKDIEIIMKHQKSILDKINLVFEHYEYKNDANELKNMEKFCSEITDQLIENLKDRPRPLQVKTVNLGVKNQREVLKILPLIDPKTLDKIIFGNSMGLGHQVLEINKIAKLDQWKTAKEMVFYEFTVPAEIQSFKHFSKVVLTMDEVTAETIRRLRETFQNSPTMSYFEIYYNPLRNGQDLSTLFGHRFDGSYNDEFGSARWFFRIPKNEKEVISIQSNLHSWLVLSRIEISDLPENTLFF